MTISEAGEILKRAGVDPHIYNIGSPTLAECMVLQKEGSEWIIYIWERGQRDFIKTYQDEDSAAQEFVREVMRVHSWSSSVRN